MILDEIQEKTEQQSETYNVIRRASSGSFDAEDRQKHRIKIIFFGNQKLVQGLKSDVTTITDALESAGYEIIANITTKEDLAKIPNIIEVNKNVIGVLASFGHIVPTSVIDLFEPIGILNIHPSLLPKYRGSTPIETTILNGDEVTGVSIMKITKAMDAGEIYAQKSLKISPEDDKFTLCKKLTTLGSSLLLETIKNIIDTTAKTTPQDETKATFTTKLDKSLSPLDPSRKTASQLNREVRAFLAFPKSKYTFHNISCTVTLTHVSDHSETPLDLKCADGKYLNIERLHPENKKEMPTADFLRGLHQ
jgi:methionyl-tRNA formyltransferase